MRNYKYSLCDVKWCDFFLKDYFDFYLSKGDNQANLLNEGNVPLVSSGSSDNGISKFIAKGDGISEKYESGLLTIDMFGKPFFHNYEFYAVSHGRINILRSKLEMSRYIKQFIIKSIEASTKGVFSYNRMCSQKRLNTIRIMLPIDKNSKPNWFFMDAYMKERESVQKYNLLAYYKKRLHELSFRTKLVKCTQWGEFFFSDIFDRIQRGKRLTKANQLEGAIPYISSTSLNNGVDSFIGNTERVRRFSKNLTLANSGSVGACFYQDYEYIASDHVTSLSLSSGNKYIYIFLASIIQRLEEKYSFNREINDSRIKREKLILPIDEEGKPNWEYMESYIKNIEKEKIRQILNHLEK